MRVRYLLVYLSIWVCVCVCARSNEILNGEENRGIVLHANEILNGKENR